MTLHKLSAGDGYTYLTRQVASANELRPAGQALADYYSAHGNPPGTWLGAGAAALGVAGTAVSETQMRALFGEGAHPNRDAMLASGATKADTRLGAAYPHYAPTDEGSCRSPPARGGRLRPSLHAGQVRVGAVGARRARGSGGG